MDDSTLTYRLGVSPQRSAAGSPGPPLPAAPPPPGPCLGYVAAKGKGKPIHEPPLAKVRLEIVDLWQRLFDDESSKDVQLVTKDGTAWAHSVILTNLSQPLKAALTGGMSESQTKVISFEDCYLSDVTFMLHLAYTGHVAECSLREAEPQVKVKGKSQGKLDATNNNNSTEVPIDVLLGCAVITHKWQIQGIFDIIIDYIKKHVNTENFDSVMSCAIAIDCSTLKLTCLRFAESSGSIWNKFESQSLSDEVTHELGTIWPASHRATQGRLKEFY